MTGRPPPSPKPAPRREPSSPFDPTGIDDHQGGIPLGERRPALRATAWISLAVVVIAIAALAWRTVERQAVDRAYADGVQALSAGRVDAARIAFDRVLAKRPEWAAAWRQRGYAAASPEEARRPAKGIEDFDRALAIGASSGTDAATVTRWRADRGLARVEAGDHGAALDDLRHAADARNTPDDQRRLALALAMTGDWAGAKAAYDRAVASGAQPLWLGERALVSMRLGDDEAAGVDLVRCAQLDPACAELFGTRAGQLARDLGRAPPPGAR